MPTLDPATGPVPRAKFYALVDAAYGEATKVIRKYDPMFGRKEGEQLQWLVTYTQEIYGYAYVHATSEKEARELAKRLNRSKEIAWETPEKDEGQLLSVEVEDER